MRREWLMAVVADAVSFDGRRKGHIAGVAGTEVANTARLIHRAVLTPVP